MTTPARCPVCHREPSADRGAADDGSQPYVVTCWDEGCTGEEVGIGATMEAAIIAWNKAVVATFLAACAACPCRDRSRVN